MLPLVETPERPPDVPPAPRPEAVLLIGPTGSGKTPLGDLLEARGLWGRRCLHFDFGVRLRQCAAGEGPAGLLDRQECAMLERMLRDGALLEDEHFPIAERLLRGFLAARGAGPGDLVVLNGLPRHAGQARDIEPIVTVQAVIHLACLAPVAARRIRGDVGGDRAGRRDDGTEGVRRRIDVFHERTQPLTARYAARGATVLDLCVGPATTAEALSEELERRRPGGHSQETREC